MVKKLFKHESLAYLRVWLPMMLILFTVAIFGKIMYLFNIDSLSLRIIKSSATVIYVISAIAAIGLTCVFSVVRFYKNLYSCEGYLSFTLPVTPTNHITVKLITACLFQIGSILCFILSLLIITGSEFKREFLANFKSVTDVLYTACGNHLILYIIELVTLALLAMIIGNLIFYMCITIGQTFKKNRVIGAVIVYFIYYIIKQIVGTLLITGGMLIESIADTRAISAYASSHPISMIHTGLLIAVALECIFAALYFCITRYVMKNKLNLE